MEGVTMKCNFGESGDGVRILENSLILLEMSDYV